jgi:hypothetical protein
VFPNERFFWDINGLRDPQKLKHISDLTKEHNLNFIALSETGKSEFMRSFLKNLCVGRDFLRRTMAPKGRSGGMLVGVDLQVLDIGAIDEGDYYVKFHLCNKSHSFKSALVVVYWDYYVKFHLCNKSHSFKWALVVVYGPAQDDEKEGFLAEMVNMCSHEQLPTMIGGDFNILRSSKEKNNDRFNNRWPFLFNAFIDGLNLRELEMSSRKFTWANNLSSLTFVKLDRVLVTTEWEEKYALTTVQALPRAISDHMPLLLNSGATSTSGNEPLFKFECGWLLRDGFVEMIRWIWPNHIEGNNPIERWQGKIRRVRQYMRGWAKNMNDQYKKEKEHMLNSLDLLDQKVESIPLDDNEIVLKQYLNNRLAELLREEEMKWYQRAKVKELLEGDSNTKYFQLVVNGKYRKSRIFQLQHNDQIIEGEDAPKKHITKYYKNLFGPLEESTISLDDSRMDDIAQVSNVENEQLVKLFSEEEV